MAVRFDHDGDLGTIVLDDPPLNLLGGELQEGLHDALDRVTDSGVRAVLLRAEGPNFSAGAQVQRFQSAGDGSAGDSSPPRPRDSVFARLEAIPVPVVAAVHGNCLAGGLELALSCDLIWAADDAKIGLVETTLGLFPLAGGVQRLVQRIGATRAKQVIFVGGRHSAALLRDWGLVSEVTSAETLRAEATEFARRLAAGPTLAYGAIKRLAATAVSDGVAAADALSPELAARIMTTEDVRDGVRSLLANGPGHAVFHGR